MAIKRGVSLYCYQQEEFFGRMTWKDELKEVATNIYGADGIEIINQCVIRDYPMPDEKFFYEWNNEMARWGLKAVTYDCYLDTLQFRDHVMTYDESAERLKYDLRIASRMGFSNMRLCHNVPIEVVSRALPLAEELDIRITNEVHDPSPIKPKRGVVWGDTVARDVAFIRRTGTKHYGIQPDMSIFQNKPTRVMVAYSLRGFMDIDRAEAESYELLNKYDEMDLESFMAMAKERYPYFFKPDANGWILGDILFNRECADPLDLYDIIPYVYCIHGKFNEMTEIPGEPGHYEEKAIQYAEVISILNDVGYDGYIDSEYEGQRSQQDMGYDRLPNEVEQVRRHQEMLKRLIEDDTIKFKA